MSGGFLGHLRQWANLFASLRKSSTVSSSEIIRNCRKWAKIPLYTKQNNIGLFGAVFASFWKKFTVSKNFLLLVLKCLKFNCSCYKAKKWSAKCYRVPPFRPSIIPLSICQKGVVLVRIVRRNSSFYKLELKQQGPRRGRDWGENK